MAAIKSKDADAVTIYIDTGAGAGTVGDPFVPKLAQGAATDAKLDDLIAIVTPTGLTATLSNVGDSATNVTVLASNASRKSAVIVNDSSAVLYLKFGATASATSFTYKLQADDTVIIDSQNLYTGVIDGIWASDAGGSARVTELV